MKEHKAIIIGIDSLEPLFVKQLINSDDSKGFSYFYEAGTVLPMRSTFPPDTVLAWPTIYTGLIPQRFRLKPELESIFDLRIASLNIRTELRGKTFWDIASTYDKKVCIINPLFAYPPWQVNGIMVSGPSFGLRGPTLSIPLRDYVKKYRLGTYGRTPLLLHEYKEVFKEAQKQLLDVFNLTTNLLKEDNYDLVFTADYTLDRIQHFFWRFSDKGDPDNPKLFNLYDDYIKEYYRLLDRLIKYFIEKYGDEYIIIVLGDHGHARRPTKLLSVEKILNPKLRQFNLHHALRDLMYLIAYYSRIDVYMYKIIRYMQLRGILGRLTLKNNKNKQKFTKTDTAETLKHFGLKEYIGIKINTLNPETRKVLKRVITEVLRRLGIVDFIVEPKEFYGVEDVMYDADLYIKLRNFGNFPERSSFLIIPNFTRHIISGGHSLHTLFMVYSKGKISFRNKEIRVQDVAPTVLTLLGLEYVLGKNLDGVSLASVIR